MPSRCELDGRQLMDAAARYCSLRWAGCASTGAGGAVIIPAACSPSGPYLRASRTTAGGGGGLDLPPLPLPPLPPLEPDPLLGWGVHAPPPLGHGDGGGRAEALGPAPGFSFPHWTVDVEHGFGGGGGGTGALGHGLGAGHPPRSPGGGGGAGVGGGGGGGGRVASRPTSSAHSLDSGDTRSTSSHHHKRKGAPHRSALE
ncbi:hypothetical protein GPECTOR_102g63 [Gonium pectorale]|uniref:Uncharacterized protein n=1 Tax=Gonium pectorale TaxID=33097 RepID=A0A150G1E3_GONPE|nr:hypothetical protein GPECTOR_102g63 [Gonium pectorale]|eukprot:KXZ43110.1 hypothetical protein GPECTOR_102g63 [Gonium pectorale]